MADRELTEGSVRARFRDLEPNSNDENNKAYARYVSLAPATPLGHFEVTVGTTPVGLPNLHPETRKMILYCATIDFTFTDDGTTPDNTHGMIIPSATPFIYDTDPGENFLLWAASTAIVRVAYYG